MINQKKNNKQTNKKDKKKKHQRIKNKMVESMEKTFRVPILVSYNPLFYCFFIGWYIYGGLKGLITNPTGTPRCGRRK